MVNFSIKALSIVWMIVLSKYRCKVLATRYLSENMINFSQRNEVKHQNYQYNGLTCFGEDN